MYLTVPEAAAELGTTSEGVRFRIKRGTLRTEREVGRVWVILGDAPPRPGAAPSRSPKSVGKDRSILRYCIDHKHLFATGEHPQSRISIQRSYKRHWDGAMQGTWSG